MTTRKPEESRRSDKPNSTSRAALPKSADILPFPSPRERSGSRSPASGHDPRGDRIGSAGGNVWQAISEDRLVTHYQPQYDLSDGRTLAVEALVRIAETDGQLQFPASFISEAEESGMIIPLGRAVIHRACHDLASWRCRGLNIARVCINLSANQINTDVGLAGYVERTVLTHGLDFSDLEFELTERQALGADGPGMDTLQMLSYFGARLAIDDFGTGYSSVAYLSHLPIDTVKLDRAMVSRLGEDDTTERIARHLLNMGKDLGLTTIGEGIETFAQNDFLASHGCDLGQGYLIGKPMPAPSMIEFLAETAQGGGE